MTDFLDLLAKRQSVRSYSNIPVEAEKIERCLEAARLSPSACNSQPWTFIVIDEPELKEKVAKATYSSAVRFNKFAVEAPVFIAVVTEKSDLIPQMGNFLKNQQYNLIDIGMTIENFVLQAAYEDLGTCIMGWFDESKIKELLNVPSKKRINIVISLGYPSNITTRKKTRKSLDEIARYNRY